MIDSTPNPDNTQSPFEQGMNPPKKDTAEDHMPLIYAHYLMLKEIRFWGLVLFAIGLVHLFASGFLNAPWEMILALVGLAALVFKSSALFLVSAVSLVLVSVTNLVSLQPLAIIFAFIQLFMAMRNIRAFRKYFPMETIFLQSAIPMLEEDQQLIKRAAFHFPRLSLIFGSLSFIGTKVLLIAAVLFIVSSQSAAAMPDWFPYLEILLINLGGLGLAMSLASIVCKFPRRWLAILALIASLLSIVFQVLLFIR